jgi:hypothetical protein
LYQPGAQVIEAQDIGYTAVGPVDVFWGQTSALLSQGNAGLGKGSDVQAHGCYGRVGKVYGCAKDEILR